MKVEEDKSIETLAEEYVELFNKDFETSLKMKRDKYKILVRIYQVVLQEHSISPLYKKILHEIVSVQDEILSKYTKEDELLFEKWNALTDRLHSDELMQFFILGFCTAKQIEIEQNNSDNFKQKQF